MTLKLKEIAERIAAHFTRFETAVTSPKYYQPYCWVAGTRIGLRYVSYWTDETISKREAIAYLEWLDAGNHGYFGHMPKEGK